MTRPTPTLTNTDPALRRCWHPVARSTDVTDRPVRTLLLGEPWVLVRLGADRTVHAFFHRCPHRLAPLSSPFPWRNDLDHDPARMADAVGFEVKVVQEDLALQDAVDVRAFPLDPKAEVHTRADRSTLELRRMLADLVQDPDGAAPGEQPPARPGSAALPRAARAIPRQAAPARG